MKVRQSVQYQYSCNSAKALPNHRPGPSNLVCHLKAVSDPCGLDKEFLILSEPLRLGEHGEGVPAHRTPHPLGSKGHCTALPNTAL